MLICVVIGLIKRCYQCRSRGELGNCKDSFQYNATQVEAIHGVTAIPCASGWCGKVIEGESSAFREDGNILNNVKWKSLNEFNN